MHNALTHAAIANVLWDAWETGRLPCGDTKLRVEGARVYVSGECPRCSGTGRYSESAWSACCPMCGGEGVLEDDKVFAWQQDVAAILRGEEAPDTVPTTHGELEDTLSEATF